MKLNVCKYTKHPRHLSPVFFHYGVIWGELQPEMYFTKTVFLFVFFCHIRGRQRPESSSGAPTRPHQADRAHAVGPSQQLAWMLRIRGERSSWQFAVGPRQELNEMVCDETRARLLWEPIFPFHLRRRRSDFCLFIHLLQVCTIQRYR